MSPKILQIFAKAPIPGDVKTRLLADIGSELACEVYQSLLLNTVKNTRSEEWDTELWCSPDTQHPFFQSLAGGYPLSLKTQSNDDLGERMLFALKAGVENGGNVVLIGSDCPVISAKYIEQAFTVLETNDVVFGPVEDGGYVLIGCSNMHINMFNDVEWSNEKTLAQNIKAVGRCGLNYGLLEPLWDLDDIHDLERMLM